MAEGIALCAIARNEAHNLPRLLASLQDVVQEIVLVDTGSTDQTVELARSWGARVVQHPWQDDFAAARNAGLAVVRAPWVLMLDGDEALHPDDRTLLRALPDRLSGVAGCFVQVISFLGDRPGPDQVLDCRLSLFRNRPAYRFAGALHEQILPAIEQAGGVVCTVPVRILHYGYMGSGAESGRRERNCRILRGALAREPAEPFWPYALAAELIGLGEHAAALAQLAVARGSWTPGHPHYSDVLRKQVICLTELGRTAEALEQAGTGLALYPDYTDLAFLAGVAALRGGQPQAARCWFLRCLALGHPPPRYQSWRGVGSFRARAALGTLEADPWAQAAQFLAVLREVPDWAEGRLRLAHSLAAVPPEAALGWLGEGLDLSHEPTLLALGNALLQADAAGLVAALAQPRTEAAHYALAAALCRRQARRVSAHLPHDVP